MRTSLGRADIQIDVDSSEVMASLTESSLQYGNIARNMIKQVAIKLKDVAPTPSSLRAVPHVDSPSTETAVHLAQLFQHYYFDSYPTGPPKPDPSRFEYLNLISGSRDFRFHEFVSAASIVRRRTIATELGQAFCRCMLHDHFRIVYFAHMYDVLDRPTHAAFEGLRVERSGRGDVPDYLCARKVTLPLLAEAKGRSSKISFESAEWAKWQEQFSRIHAVDRAGTPRDLKGYTVATEFVSAASPASKRTTVFIQDPEPPSETRLTVADATPIGRVIVAMHYARVFSKLGLSLLAGALLNGYMLSPELSFQVPIWRCMTPPFENVTFVGGIYRTLEGALPSMQSDGNWSPPFELGAGHLVFVGVNQHIAEMVAQAARGDWALLDNLPLSEPVGVWSSEFGWLLDGSVVAPAMSFRPATTVTL